MRRKFAANLIFLFVANLLVKPFWIFGIDRVVQNKVGPEEYGTYFAVFNYSFLLSIILDFGIVNFNNRAVSRNNKRLSEYLINLLFLKFFLALIYFAFTFLSARATGFSQQQIMMLFFLAINQILLSFILYLRSNIAALQFFKTDSVISILDRLLTIIFCLVLMYSSIFEASFSIMWFIYAQTLALLITAVVALAVILGKTSLNFKIWKPKFTRLILIKSFPFAMLALTMGIYYRIDAVMIERMLGEKGAKEAGIYAASFRLLDALNMFGYLFATLLLPMFATMIRKGDSVRQLVKFSSELIFVMAICAATSCYFFGNQIMVLLYDNSNTYWSAIFGWLMITFIPMSSVYIFGTLLTANGSLKILNIIAIGGVILNVGLNLFLIPAQGALGATFATLITQFLVAIAHVMAVNKVFDFKYDLSEIIRPIMFAILSVVVAFFCLKLPCYWMLTLSLVLFLIMLLGGAFRLLPLKEIALFVKSKTYS